MPGDVPERVFVRRDRWGGVLYGRSRSRHADRLSAYLLQRIVSWLICDVLASGWGDERHDLRLKSDSALFSNAGTPSTLLALWRRRQARPTARPESNASMSLFSRSKRPSYAYPRNTATISPRWMVSRRDVVAITRAVPTCGLEL